MNKDELKQLQKQANKYIRLANISIKNNEADSYTHRAYINAELRLRKFEKKHGQHNSWLFSMKNLEEEDYDTYEELLKSVTENTRLNPEKAEAHKQSQIKFYQDQGWAVNSQQAEAMYEFKGTEVFEELMEMNLGDIPSELLERYGQFIDADYTEQDFANMITVFNQEKKFGNEDYTSNKDFIEFTDNYIKAMNERQDDFSKAVDDYLEQIKTGTIEDDVDSFFTFLYKKF